MNKPITSEEIIGARNTKANVLQEHFGRGIETISDEEIRTYLEGAPAPAETDPKTTPRVSPPPADVAKRRGLPAEKSSD